MPQSTLESFGFDLKIGSPSVMRSMHWFPHSFNKIICVLQLFLLRGQLLHELLGGP